MKMEAVVTVEHIRQHVIDDAADLISLVGLLDPIVIAPRLKEADDIAHASRLLRKILSRDLVLILCRLHEAAEQKGPTGITASIDSLLNFAASDIGADRAAELKEKRRQLIADLEAQGTKFKDVRAFRNAEIAHSLHRASRSSDNSLYYFNIAQFATQTYSLILEIERELAVAGYTPFSDSRDMVEAWPRRGSAFWDKALNL
jgi:AbiU2